MNKTDFANDLYNQVSCVHSMALRPTAYERSENDNRWCTNKIKESFNELGFQYASYSKGVTVKPLLCPIETTMCSRVSPVSVRKFGLSPRLIIALNLSTFLDLTLSSIWYWEEEILHLRLNSGSLCTSCNSK